MMTGGENYRPGPAIPGERFSAGLPIATRKLPVNQAFQL